MAYGRKYSSSKTVGPIGRWIRDLILPSVFKSSANKTLPWLFDHRIEWPTVNQAAEQGGAASAAVSAETPKQEEATQGSATVQPADTAEEVEEIKLAAAAEAAEAVEETTTQVKDVEAVGSTKQGEAE